jgi:hypothetical protein
MNTKGLPNAEEEDAKLRIDEPVRLTASFHDTRTSSETVVIDIAQLPGAKEGDVAELQPVEESSESDVTSSKKKRLLFIVKQMNAELQRRANTAQVSIVSGTLQSVFSFSSRSPVIVRLKHPEEVEADLVEIMIRDIGLNRGDIWELSSSMINTCVFKNQKLTFLETIRATVGTIYKMGKKTFSAYVGKNTKIVFRSESARLVFLIQVTEEMYHFQEDGELMFHKVVNSLFPTIFKRWREEDTHHLLTIVFVANVDFSTASWNDLKEGERPSQTRDYYRVVVDQVNVVHWNQIMISLRSEFANFRKDIITDQMKKNIEASSRFLPTIKSDILGTISLSTTLVMDRFKDPDLRHTTNHFIMISAGNGLFDVSYNDLLDTGKRLLSSEISVDVICLAQPPLHVTPLLRYRDYSDNLHHCVPGWIDISYWNEPFLKNRRQWLPRCKIYELQMMGIMENDMSSVTVEYLKNLDSAVSAVDYMDSYDKDVFSANKEGTKPSTEDDSTGLSSAQSIIMPSLPKRLPSSSSLRWKFSNSSIIKAVPTTASSPIFSVSKTALSSLQQYTRSKSSNDEKSLSTDSSTLTSIPSEASSIKSSTRQFLGMNIPATKANKNSHLQHHQFQQKNIPSLSTSPLSSHSNTNKEKFSVADSLKALVWTEIENISQKIDPGDFKKFNVGKWQDVFPEDIQRRLIKWRSLSSPSELPATTPIFPEVDDFNQNFTFQTHTISLSDENEKYMTPGSLMREMIHLRLMLGFQICHGPKVERVESKRQSEGNASLLIKYLPTNEDQLPGARIYLSLDEDIHRILFNFDGSINVQRYQRVNSGEFHRTKPNVSNITIRTRYQRNFHPYSPNPKLTKPQVFNWNKYDQFLAGYSDEIDDADDDDKLNMKRIKFVLLPAEIPKSTYLANDNKELLSAEETRVEGLRKLIATLHRGSFRPEGRLRENRRKVKEEALPEISFYTGDLVSFLSEQYFESGNLRTVESHGSNSVLNNNGLNKSIPLSDLYALLHGPKGIKFNDRRWHWKVHRQSFIGLELVTWLVDNFNDINTREEATEFGEELMDKEFLNHVENRHKFLDGYYFYTLNQPEPSENPSSPLKSEDLRSRSNSIGSNNGKFGSKLSMTPVIAPQNDDNNLMRTGSNSSKRHTLDNEISRVQTINSQSIKEKETVVLSHSLKFDLDPNRISYKPEIITVHYDKVHNPNHCFHIRLEWLTATPKLIDDAINSWSRMCERYGLLLVETPWNELCEIPKLNPFHSYVDIKLAINPWVDPEFYNEEILQSQKFFYHIYLLEYSGFLMDNRASFFFSSSDEKKFDILYSWGKPTFKYAQYIHKTGAYIAEIRDTGDLYLAPNNNHVSRVNVGNISSQQKGPSFVLDSRQIMLEFRSTCFSPVKLRKIFLRAKEQWVRSQNNTGSGRLTPIFDDLLAI